MRLIDADALLKEIKNPYQYREVAHWVKKQPTIESEHPITCKDCSYYKSIKRTDRHQCINDFVAVIETKPDDFCSRAERRC